ncbi:MAG: CvpA family protein [Clostridia bacterium]|nr:CvpA family protein [Clostridia bacterium]
MNIVDIIIIAVIAVSALFGLYRGFISGVLSVAALIGSAVLAFVFSGTLSAYLEGNRALVDTLLYYTDAGSRISDLSLSLLPVSQVNDSALAQIIQGANLPAAFESAFLTRFAQTQSGITISQLLSQTIVSVSISILSYLICFLLCYVVLTFVIHLIGYVFELPVLRHLDSLIGGVFGLMRGVVLVFIFFMLVPIVLAVAPVEQIKLLIEESTLAPMFDSQMILHVLQARL